MSASASEATRPVANATGRSAVPPIRARRRLSSPNQASAWGSATTYVPTIIASASIGLDRRSGTRSSSGSAATTSVSPTATPTASAASTDSAVSIRGRGPGSAPSASGSWTPIGSPVPAGNRPSTSVSRSPTSDWERNERNVGIRGGSPTANRGDDATLTLSPMSDSTDSGRSARCRRLARSRAADGRSAPPSDAFVVRPIPRRTAGASASS